MTIPIRITFGQQQARQYWRVNHDNPLWRYNVPEVFRIYPQQNFAMTEPLQWLLRRMNLQITDLQFRALFGNKLGFTNGTGMPDGRDYINRIDMKSGHDPHFDQARICGGAIVSGRVDGNIVWLDAINVNGQIPTAEYVMENQHLYFTGVNIAEDAYKNPVVRHLKNGWGVPVYIPLLVDQLSYLPLSMLTKVTPPFPSPLQYP